MIVDDADVEIEMSEDPFKEAGILAPPNLPYLDKNQAPWTKPVTALLYVVSFTWPSVTEILLLTFLSGKLECLSSSDFFGKSIGLHDTQHNVIHHNDNQHNDNQHNSISIMTISIMTISIMTISIMTIRIMTISIITISIIQSA